MAKTKPGMLSRRVNELEDAVARLFTGTPPVKKTKKRRKPKKAKVVRKAKKAAKRVGKAVRKAVRKAR